MLAPVVLAALFAPVCHGQLAPPTPVEQAMEFRRKFGLPAGRRHVRRVQRSGARRDDQGFGFTRREWRYWNQRYRVEMSDKRAVERYLARRPGLKAGISIEDDWPRRPYLQVLVTRNPERHQPALRDRYRFRLRVVEVLHPVAELQALEERIDADRDALEAEGFDIRLVYYDVERGDVLVQMVSARTDHEAYFEARYGPYVTTFAVADEKEPACADLDGVRVSERRPHAPAALDVQHRRGALARRADRARRPRRGRDRPARAGLRRARRRPHGPHDRAAQRTARRPPGDRRRDRAAALMLGAVALASLALVCQGQQAPLTPEQERQKTLEGYADARAFFGFRSDIPYIEELIRRGRWESDVGFTPRGSTMTVHAFGPSARTAPAPDGTTWQSADIEFCLAPTMRSTVATSMVRVEFGWRRTVRSSSAPTTPSSRRTRPSTIRPCRSWPTSARAARWCSPCQRTTRHSTWGSSRRSGICDGRFG